MEDSEFEEIEPSGKIVQDVESVASDRAPLGVGVVGRAAALADLATIGYCVGPANEAVVVAAFQRRFRPERWDGLLDAETCVRLREVRMAVDAAQAARDKARRARFN